MVGAQVRGAWESVQGALNFPVIPSWCHCIAQNDDSHTVTTGLADRRVHIERNARCVRTRNRTSSGGGCPPAGPRGIGGSRRRCCACSCRRRSGIAGGIGDDGDEPDGEGRRADSGGGKQRCASVAASGGRPGVGSSVSFCGTLIPDAVSRGRGTPDLVGGLRRPIAGPLISASSTFIVDGAPWAARRLDRNLMSTRAIGYPNGEQSLPPLRGRRTGIRVAGAVGERPNEEYL